MGECFVAAPRVSKQTGWPLSGPECRCKPASSQPRAATSPLSWKPHENHADRPCFRRATSRRGNRWGEGSESPSSSASSRQTPRGTRGALSSGASRVPRCASPRAAGESPRPSTPPPFQLQPRPVGRRRHWRWGHRSEVPPLPIQKTAGAGQTTGPRVMGSLTRSPARSVLRQHQRHPANPHCRSRIPLPTLEGRRLNHLTRCGRL